MSILLEARQPHVALHARITSQTDVLAIETERLIDGLVREIDRRFAIAINGIAEKVAAIASSPGFAGRFGMADQIKRLLAQAVLVTRAEMLSQFNRLAAWRQRQTSRVLAATLPQTWLARAAAARRSRRLREAVELTVDDAPANAWQDLVFPPPSQQHIHNIVMAPARFDGKTWDQRLGGLSKLISDKSAAATQIIQGMQAGENIAQIRKRIEPLVAGVRSAAQRIARTEARRVAETAQEDSWNQLGDMLIGVQFRAVLDERTRPEHRARNGKIIYKDSPEWANRPQLPDQPHCRCSYAPVLSEPESVRNDPSLYNDFATAGAPDAPDPATYDDWFAQAAPHTKTKAVGVARYNAAAKATGVVPQYADFITPGGELLTPAQIAAETPQERLLRKMDVQAVMSLRRDEIQQIAKRGFLLSPPKVVDPFADLLPSKPVDPFADLNPSATAPSTTANPFDDLLSKAPTVDASSQAMLAAAKQAGKAAAAADKLAKAAQAKADKQHAAKLKADAKNAADEAKAKIAAQKKADKAAVAAAKAKQKEQAKADKESQKQADKTAKLQAQLLAVQQKNLASQAKLAQIQAEKAAKQAELERLKQEKADAAAKLKAEKAAAAAQAKADKQAAKSSAAWPKIDDVTVVQPLGGSTGAQLVQDKAGNRFVLKRGASSAHIREEFAAESLYRMLGVDVPDSRLYDGATGPAKLSRFIPGDELGKLAPAAKSKAQDALRKSFVADAWLGNWDVVGANQDNVLVSGGKPQRIDVGGSLRYRAQGGVKKAQDFDGVTREIYSMRDPQRSSSANVFATIDDDSLATQIKNTLAGVTDADIRKAVAASGAPNAKGLVDTLAARRDHMLDWAERVDERQHFEPANKERQPYTPSQQEVTQLSEAAARFDEYIREWLNRASPSEQADARTYTGGAFVKINGELRGQGRLSKQSIRIASAIQDAIEREGEWAQPRTVWRGASGVYANDLFNEAKEKLLTGDVVAFKGVGSFTINPEIATDFAGAFRPVIIEVRKKTGVFVARISKFAHEQEILGRHGEQYDVVEVHDNVRVAGETVRMIKLVERDGLHEDVKTLRPSP